MLFRSGNVDPEDVGKKFAFLFRGIPRRAAAPRVAVKPIELRYKRVEHELDIERPQVWVLWKLPPVNSPEFAKADALVLFARKLARLAEEWEFASDVLVTTFGGNLAPTLALVVQLDPGGDVDEALDYVWRSTRTAHWGMGNVDFDRVTRNRIKMGFVERIEALGSRAGLVADAIQFSTGEVDFGASGQEYLINEFHKIDKLTADGYRDFVKRTLDRDRAVVVVFKPKQTGARGDTRAKLAYTRQGHERQPEPLVDASEALRPLPAPRTSSILSTAQRYTLPNGMAVVLLSYPGLPIVHAELVLSAGSAFEPAGRAGLAEVAARYLQPPPDANFLFWVSLGTAVDDDRAAFVARGLNIYTDVVIESLERIITTGDYDQKALERNQRRVRNQFASADHRNRFEYERAVAAALYGDRHPYAVNGAATPDTIGRIGHDAAMAFKRERYVARNATLIVVGNFDAAKARATIADTFGGWPSGTPVPALPARAAQRGAQAIGVVGDDQQQMEVTIEYPAPTGRDGQHAARMILAQMLDQEMAAIRTQLGSTYGTYAQETDHLGPNGYRMGGRVDSARAGESLVEMRKRVEALRRGDDFARRFALARRQVLRQLVAESTDTQQMAARLARIAAFGLGPDYYDSLVKYVAAASPAQVRAIIAEELRPDQEIVVCMADRPTLDRAFRQAGLARPRFIAAK